MDASGLMVVLIPKQGVVSTFRRDNVVYALRIKGATLKS